MSAATSFKRVAQGYHAAMSAEVIEEFMDDFEPDHQVRPASGPKAFGNRGSPARGRRGAKSFKYSSNKGPSAAWAPGSNIRPTASVISVALGSDLTSAASAAHPFSSGTKNSLHGNATGTAELAKLASRDNPCFLTASVSTVKQWSRYRDEIPMLIEIFGTLEKLAAPEAGQPLTREFHLQDGISTLVGRFYEIDRPLPTVSIGQFVRCVGRIDKDGCLLCVSIREASKHEQQWRNKLMAISARAMYKRMTSLNEN